MSAKFNIHKGLSVMLFILTVIIFLYVFIYMLLAPMAPPPWNLREDANAKYELSINNADSNFPFNSSQNINFYSYNIKPIKNITDWWTRALLLEPLSQISYKIKLDHNQVLNSTQQIFVLPIFFPGKINTTLLKVVADSLHDNISQFNITNVNSFVGETTIAYQLQRNNSKYFVTIVFDNRYYAIASCSIVNQINIASINLILSGTNNDATPNNVFHLLASIAILYIVVIVLAVPILVIYKKLTKKKKGMNKKI